MASTNKYISTRPQISCISRRISLRLNLRRQSTNDQPQTSARMHTALKVLSVHCCIRIIHILTITLIPSIVRITIQVLEELHDLQNEIYGNLFDYPKMTKKENLKKKTKKRLHKLVGIA